MIIDVKSMAAAWKQEIKEIVEGESHNKTLAILKVGNDAASARYVAGKVKDCAEVGIQAEVIEFEDGVDWREIREWLKKYKGYHYSGIILQLPANVTLNRVKLFEYGVIRAFNQYINSAQDVDGFKKDSIHIPATPRGIMEILKRMNYDVAGKRVCVIGRGKLVGKPLVPLLIDAGATVISCNSKTKDLESEISRSDVVVCATGHRIVREDMREMLHGKIIIDAGIWFEDGKMRGDVDKSLYDMEDTWFTSVPGGVGLMTRCALLKNVTEA